MTMETIILHLDPWGDFTTKVPNITKQISHTISCKDNTIEITFERFKNDKNGIPYYIAKTGKIQEPVDFTCDHCNSDLSHSVEFDSYYCSECEYWTESVCPNKSCNYCKDRPKYPPKNICD